jgi:hypothetical protein
MDSSLSIESVAYLERLVAVGRAVGDCLGKPLDPVNGAENYEQVSAGLADPTVWPDDAVTKAHIYRIQYPWLLDIFEQKQEGGRCPAWEQIAEDLLNNEKFLTRLAERTRAWSHRTRTKKRTDGPRRKTPKKTATSSPLDEAADEFGYVAWEMVRIIIGKAEEWLAKWNEKVRLGTTKAEESWLDLALNFGRGDMARPVREEETGRKRPPKKDDTTATADPVPGPPPKVKSKVRVQTDLQRHEDESRSERPPGTDDDEQPDVISETVERDAELSRTLETLTPGERTVVVCKCWGGMTLPEIDETEGWRPGTAARHWKTAKDNLRHRLPGDYHQ